MQTYKMFGTDQETIARDQEAGIRTEIIKDTNHKEIKEITITDRMEIGTMNVDKMVTEETIIGMMEANITTIITIRDKIDDYQI